MQVVWVQKLFMRTTVICHMFSSFYLVNADTGTLLYGSQYALFHISCLWTSLLSPGYCWRANSADFPHATISGVKCIWVYSMLRTLWIPLHIQPYGCCTITMCFTESLCACQLIPLECVIISFKHQPTKSNYSTEKNNTWLYLQFSGKECFMSDSSVHGQLTIIINMTTSCFIVKWRKWYW